MGDIKSSEVKNSLDKSLDCVEYFENINYYIKSLRLFYLNCKIFYLNA
jgi:hypothetical protein